MNLSGHAGKLEFYVCNISGWKKISVGNGQLPRTANPKSWWISLSDDCGSTADASVRASLYPDPVYGYTASAAWIGGM